MLSFFLLRDLSNELSNITQIHNDLEERVKVKDSLRLKVRLVKNEYNQIIKETKRVENKLDSLLGKAKYKKKTNEQVKNNSSPSVNKANLTFKNEANFNGGEDNDHNNEKSKTENKEPQKAVDKDSEIPSASKSIILLGISEVYTDENFKNKVKLNEEFLFVKVTSKKQVSNIKDYIDFIIINKKDVNVIDVVMKKDKVHNYNINYDYILKIKLLENVLINGINKMVIKSGEVDYFKSFISKPF